MRKKGRGQGRVVRSRAQELAAKASLMWQQEWPEGIPKAKTKGVPGMGLTFQRKVGRLLRAGWPESEFGLWEGMWIKADGKWSQPDFVLWGRDRVWVIEAKLTQKDVDAIFQLVRYRRLVKRIQGKVGDSRPVCGVQVTGLIRRDWRGEGKVTLRGAKVALEEIPAEGGLGLWGVVV